MLKRGACVNETTNEGNTALHVACEKGYADVIGSLLKFGADVNARNHVGKTAFEQLPNRPSSKAAAMMLIRYIVKLEALSQSVCEENKQMAQSCEYYLKFNQACHKEIDTMKSCRIDVNSFASYFYIFSKDEEKLAALLRNEEIVAAFEASYCPRLFRIYGNDLATKFKVAKKRAEFLIAVEDVLLEVFDHMLPVLIIQMIAGYLKYDDVIAFPGV